ncbi:MAG: membrane protein insertion efficiency factor YidD [Alphaproteobacteria bacterium]
MDRHVETDRIPVPATLAARALRLLIRIYQLVVSPLLPAHCRYWPTCSNYAKTAIHDHGALAGGWLAVRRLGRCHPWGGSGYDPVPERRKTRAHRKGEWEQHV